MPNISFRAKILISFVIILSCALILPSIYFRHELENNIRKDAVHNAKKQLRTVSWMLESQQGPFTLASLNKRFVEIKKNFQVRITFIDTNGKVIADSDVSPATLAGLENHASRPEVAQSQVEPMGMSIRFSSTLGKHLIYLAQPETIAGIGPGTLRISMPYSRVKDFLDIMTKDFLGIIALTLLIFTILTSVFASQLARSIRHLVSIAISIGEGEYSKRIRVSPGKEFAPLLKAINHMAERIESNIHTITSQKFELEAILNGMSEGVLALNGSGDILEWNHSMEVIFPDILHKRGHRPIEAVRIPELESTCQELLGKTQPGPVNLQLKTTSEKYYDVTIVPTGKDEPRLIVVFHDITEIKRLETVRKDFVANVSHELRTPLTSIKGYAETLLSMDASKDEKVHQFLGIILKHTDAMAKMLQDLLQLARIEAQNDTHPSDEQVQIKAALAMAQKSIAHLIASKGIILEEDLPEGDCQVAGQSAQIEQVFKNLLENAIKYAPQEQGAIKIRIREDNGGYLFEIDDNGPGIPLKDQERIFERFYRVEKDRNSKIAGTGLGLAICRHIILQHGGKIWVTSPLEHGRGSRFSFTLKKNHVESTAPRRDGRHIF